MNQAKDWMSTDEYATYMGVSPSTIRKKANQGTFGRSTRIYRQDVADISKPKRNCGMLVRRPISKNSTVSG